jgi:NAD(P)-dependent dehydrogenase (short-subunit alcohol dehydrogenase family)
MNIVITGASRGIGLELARQALQKGHTVFAVARQPQASAELQTLKEKSGTALQLFEADLENDAAPSQIAAAVAWTQVDLLINNAGVYAKGETTEDFLNSFRINSVAPYQVTRALLPKLKKAQTPKVVQITSLMGSIEDNQSGGSAAYRASKSALNMLNKTLSIDEPEVTMIVVHPGWVQTRMGGKSATTVEESASGIWKVIDRITLKDTGAFFDFEGDRLPW